VPLADAAEGFDQCEIARQPWFLKIRTPGLAPVIGRQTGDTLARVMALVSSPDCSVE
jgi:hypothetical protein